MRQPRRALGYGTAAGVFLGLSLVAALFADLGISALDPWSDLKQFAAGFAPPDFTAVAAREVVLTIAFAVAGVGFGSLVGLALSLGFARSRAIRLFAAAMRSVHELFWALLLLQITGISPWTGVLAVGIPYAGIFAKVYAEMMEEADLSAESVLPRDTSLLSRFLYARAPLLSEAFRTYTLYRLECGLRSSLILGFIGIPTIGDELKSAFRPGHYHEAAALLLVFYALIATRGLWARVKALPVLLPGAIIALMTLTTPLPGLPISTRLINFLGSIVPLPIRTGHGSLAAWLWDIALHQIGPGLGLTLVLSQLAATLAAVFALLAFPMVSQRFNGRVGRVLGRGFLVIVRGTPDFMFAYLLLQLLGLSMLPAVLALGIHNGGIIAYLMGQHADALDYRRDAPKGLDLYAYETVPRLFGQFTALVLYRYEIIVRESAILGTLSIATLGFYVAGAMDDFKMDQAVVLLVATGLLSLMIDVASRTLRRRLRVERRPTRLSDQVRGRSSDIALDDMDLERGSIA
jgi:phosphonate transport system permease protein